MIIDLSVRNIRVRLHNEANRVWFPIRISNCSSKPFAREDLSVHCQFLLARCELRLVGRTLPAHIVDVSFTADAKTNRVPPVDTGGPRTVVGGHGDRGSIRIFAVDEPVAALFDSCKIGAGIDLIDAVAKKVLPVVRHHFVQVVDQFIKCERDNERPGIAACTQEDAFEVIERLPLVGQFSNKRVGIEPEEFALLVVILSALPI